MDYNILLSYSSTVKTHPECALLLEKVYALRQIIQVQLKTYNSTEEKMVLNVSAVGEY